jgi:hypothetical protein
MKDLKGAGLADRLAAAAAAKAALLDKLRPKPGVAAPVPTDRHARRAAELKEVRAARAAGKAATAQVRAEAVTAAADAVTAAEEQALADKRGARKERKQLSKAEAQAKRDARYAARKARR